MIADSTQLTFQEYETRQTPESKLVKVSYHAYGMRCISGRKLMKQDLDRFELALQAVEYERCELRLLRATRSK